MHGRVNPTVLIVFSCREEITRLPESCNLCLFFEVNSSNETECVTTASDYEKTFGLMLLSKKELINPTANPFNNQSLIRGYLTASVKISHVLFVTTVVLLRPAYIAHWFPTKHIGFPPKNLADVCHWPEYCGVVLPFAGLCTL